MITKDSTIKTVECGKNFTLIYKTSGDLFAYGSNFYGECGLKKIKRNFDSPTLVFNKRIDRLFCGDYFFAVIVEEEPKKALLYGDNEFFSLGN